MHSHSHPASESVDLFGIPSASVHYQQSKPDLPPDDQTWDDLSYADSKAMERIERLYAGDVPHAETLETRFRHGGWLRDRQRVWESLQRCRMPAKRLERFAQCGGGATCEVQQGTGRSRLRAFYCGDRFCVPCATARSRRVSANLRHLAEGKDVRFLTLTLRGTDEPLADVFDRLIRSFVRLREQRFWRNYVSAGAYCVEIKRGANLKMWHVHLHALVVGSYIPHHELRTGWEKASGGSTVVDIRPLGKDSRRVGYVAKYACKGFDRSVLAVADDLDECLCALRGRRVFSTFGAWRSVEVERELPEPGRWRAVGRFSRVWAAACEGDRWAVGFFRDLGVDVTVEIEHAGRSLLDHDFDDPQEREQTRF